MLVDTNKVERLAIPHELGNWIEIRQLTGVEMDEASDVSTSRTLKQYKESLDAILGAGRDRQRDESQRDRKALYDSRTLLNKAVTGWSYEAPVTPDNIELLDGATRDWIWEEIVNRNTRPLQSKTD